MRQLALQLAAAPAPALDNFVVGANAEVLAALAALARGEGERFIYLWGGPGSGRTHLLQAVARAWAAAGRRPAFCPGTAGVAAAADADAVAVDDVERLDAAAQIALFNAYNTLKEGGGLLLAAGNVPPARLPLRPDLLTRLAWGLVYEVQVLSEDDRRRAVHDYAGARGFRLPAEVAEYLLARAPRDLHTLRSLVDELDRLSLEEKRAVTVPLARDVLQSVPKS